MNSTTPNISNESHDSITKNNKINKEENIRLGISTKNNTQFEDTIVKKTQSQRNFYAIKKELNQKLR